MKKISSKNIFLIVIATFIISIGINGFVIPTSLGEGGAIGISLILHYIFGISPALSSLIINTLAIILGWKYLNKKNTIYTVLTVILISLFLSITKTIDFNITSQVIAIIFGGILIGTGTGMIIIANSTLGGTSVIAKIISKYTGFKTSKILFILDSIVVGLSIFAIPFQNVLFTIVMLYLIEKFMSFVIEGFIPQKAFTIISQQSKHISDEVYKSTGRGSTSLKGQGQFSHNEFNVLYIIVSHGQVKEIKKIINKIDPDSFVVIHDVRDVLGNGFLKSES